MESPDQQMRHFQRPTATRYEFPKVKRSISVIIIILIGFLSGALGFGIMTVYFPPIPSSEYPATSLPIPASVSTDSLARGISSSALSSAQNIVSIVVSRVRSANVYDQLTDPSEYIGEGVVVTSDGWVATTVTLVRGAAYDVWFGGVYYPAQNVVHDPYADVYFLKTSARSLNPVDLQAAIPSLGDSLIMVSSSVVEGMTYQSYRVSGVNYIPTLTKQDYLLSTEEASHFIKVDREFTSLTSPSLFDASGRFVGLAKIVNKKPVVLQASQLRTSLDLILRNQQARDLGITYVDRTLVSNGEDRGVLVYHPTKNPVRVNSLAARYGIMKNDIITRVNGIPIDRDMTFDILWRRYCADDKTVFTIIRSGSEGTIELAR